jgi:hypothetical protein
MTVRRLIVALLLGALLTAAPAGAVTATAKHHHPPAKKKKATKKKKPAAKKKKKTTKKKPAPAPPAGARELAGTLRLKAGAHSPTVALTGSYFRMVLPGGSAARGPFFSNPDSTAADHSYTLLAPGTDGGLLLGAYQDPPAPAFASNGNALAARIVTPTKFAGVDFSVSTSATDPQTGTAVPAPAVALADGRLTGQVQAWTAAWNRQWFNQGAPKPDGSTPGLTTRVSGTYDEATKAFVLDWASGIVGGPFNGFSGVWHLEGSFAPRDEPSTAPAQPGGPLAGLLPPPLGATNG